MLALWFGGQTMTKAEHNRPIPKLFSNRPSASAAEVYGLKRELIIFFEFMNSDMSRLVTCLDL